MGPSCCSCDSVYGRSDWGTTALTPLSVGGSLGYGLSREFWKGPSMQTCSHSGYWLPLQIPGIGDETVKHMQFQNETNSALLGRGGLNTSSSLGSPCPCKSSPVLLSSPTCCQRQENGRSLPYSRLRQLSVCLCYLENSVSTLGVVSPMCK